MNKPKVAIITRTKNRPILLERAINSVLNQSFDNWIHVIVNDSEDKSETEDLIRKYYSQDASRIKIINNINSSKGPDAILNLGIKGSESEYIVIHDDDDTWEKNFMEKTVSYLDSEPQVGGVITHMNYVIEKITENKIEILDKYPFNTEIKEINLFKTLMSKFYPCPVGFIYRRICYEDVGQYNETLIKSSDKEFWLRFLAKYDVDIIPICLANYHTRPYDNNKNSNSTFNSKIYKDNSYWENKMMSGLLRKDMEENKLGVGFIANLLSSFSPFINHSPSKSRWSILEGKKAVLYGAGTYFEELYKNYAEDFKKMNIVGILDQDKQKQGGALMGYKIYPPEKIKELAPDVIILTVANKSMVLPFVQGLISENNLNCEIIQD